MNTLISRNGFCGSVGRVTHPMTFSFAGRYPDDPQIFSPGSGGEGPRDFLFRRSGLKSPPSE